MREECAFRTSRETCALNIRDFGAAGDGQTDDTSAIQFALSSLPADGRLYFPPGRYLSRPLSLKSRITIELAEGAVLLGCPDRERYPVVPGVVPDMDGGSEIHFGGFEGEAQPMYQSLLTAQYAHDIKIVGLGTVDGNGANSHFWTKYREFPTARPRLLFFNRCENVTLHGVHVCDSPSWHIHPYYSKNIGMYDLRFSAPKDSPTPTPLNRNPAMAWRSSAVALRWATTALPSNPGKSRSAPRSTPPPTATPYATVSWSSDTGRWFWAARLARGCGI